MKWKLRLTFAHRACFGATAAWTAKFLRLGEGGHSLSKILLYVISLEVNEEMLPVKREQVGSSFLKKIKCYSTATLNHTV